jgi:2-polyprenyl-6-methoxyphenol hydroxylase-like FAD-dependent oxidoreductase
VDRSTDHVVVLGASMAGLLAARVLADHYQHVTIVERDELPPIGQHRKGVPHGRHLHALHARGREILDELFPDFTAEATAAGAVGGDLLANLRWQFPDAQLRQQDAGLPLLFASRPFLEGHVRERVLGLPQVKVLERCSVAGLLVAPDGREVTGARVNDAEGQLMEIEADLVVDATGRGSRTPLWLSELGYQAPAQDKVEVGLGYSSRTYRLRPGALGHDQMLLTVGTPDNPRMGALAVMEGGRHMLSVGGICGDYPPTDPAEFVSSLPTGDIAAALDGAEPLGDPVTFRFPASTRNRYERLSEFPAGLLVIGDAVCSFNPIYGQGMTVAALQALALRRFLSAGQSAGQAGRAGTALRFFKDIATVIDVPWDIAVGADLGYPQVPGARPAKVRFINAYLRKLQAAAVEDGELALSFVRVLGMVDRPEGLMRPGTMLRVLRGNLRRPASPRAASATIAESAPVSSQDAEAPAAQ